MNVYTLNSLKIGDRIRISKRWESCNWPKETIYTVYDTVENAAWDIQSDRGRREPYYGKHYVLSASPGGIIGSEYTKHDLIRFFDVDENFTDIKLNFEEVLCQKT